MSDHATPYSALYGSKDDALQQLHDDQVIRKYDAAVGELVGHLVRLAPLELAAAGQRRDDGRSGTRDAARGLCSTFRWQRLGSGVSEDRDVATIELDDVSIVSDDDTEAGSDLDPAIEDGKLVMPRAMITLSGVWAGRWRISVPGPNRHERADSARMAA